VEPLPQEFEAELLSFPISNHDDQVDSLAYAWQALGLAQDAPKLSFTGATKKRAW
jgi:phage terminase large subunit-like protein